jgi:hypothetical protein
MAGSLWVFHRMELGALTVGVKDEGGL